MATLKTEKAGEYNKKLATEINDDVVKILHEHYGRNLTLGEVKTIITKTKIIFAITAGGDGGRNGVRAVREIRNNIPIIVPKQNTPYPGDFNFELAEEDKKRLGSKFDYSGADLVKRYCTSYLQKLVKISCLSPENIIVLTRRQIQYDLTVEQLCDEEYMKDLALPQENIIQVKDCLGFAHAINELIKAAALKYADEIDDNTVIISVAADAAYPNKNSFYAGIIESIIKANENKDAVITLDATGFKKEEYSAFGVNISDGNNGGIVKKCVEKPNKTQLEDLFKMTEKEKLDISVFTSCLTINLKAAIGNANKIKFSKDNNLDTDEYLNEIAAKQLVVLLPTAKDWADLGTPKNSNMILRNSGFFYPENGTTVYPLPPKWARLSMLGCVGTAHVCDCTAIGNNDRTVTKVDIAGFNNSYDLQVYIEKDKYGRISVRLINLDEYDDEQKNFDAKCAILKKGEMLVQKAEDVSVGFGKESMAVGSLGVSNVTITAIPSKEKDQIRIIIDFTEPTTMSDKEYVESKTLEAKIEEEAYKEELSGTYNENRNSEVA